MGILSKFTKSAAVAATVSIGSLGAASAATVTACGVDSPDVSSLVTPTTGCETIDGAANIDTSAEANALSLGGETDWTALEKFETDPPPDGDGFPFGGSFFDVTGDKKSGTITILAAVLAAYDEFLIVFKDGTIADPANQVAYTATAGVLTYQSPFFNPTCTSATPLTDCTQKDISFIQLFGRTEDGGGGGPDPIPLPASGLLLLAGAAGLGAMKKLRKKP